VFSLPRANETKALSRGRSLARFITIAPTSDTRFGPTIFSEAAFELGVGLNQVDARSSPSVEPSFVTLAAVAPRGITLRPVGAAAIAVPHNIRQPARARPNAGGINVELGNLRAPEVGGALNSTAGAVLLYRDLFLRLLLIWITAEAFRASTNCSPRAVRCVRYHACRWRVSLNGCRKSLQYRNTRRKRSRNLRIIKPRTLVGVIGLGDRRTSNEQRVGSRNFLRAAESKPRPA
jgi:hypothetical protein